MPAILLAFGLLVPGGAGAAARPAAGPLAPVLAKLASPEVSDSPEAEQAEALGVPAEGPGSLVREGGRVVVEAHFEAGALARIEALRAAGAKVTAASRRYQTVALSVDPEDLEALAEVPGLGAVVPSRAPVFYGAGEAENGIVTRSTGACEGGSVVSQGLEQLNVSAAREAFGTRGAGETIGVISDSFDRASESTEGGPIATHAHEDEVTDDLPGTGGDCGGPQLVPVRVVAEGPGGTTDEGRAMLQVVHDLAPDAELAFATAYSTELEFAHNIERLAEPVSAGGGGADVIVDDVGYFAEPFYQDGPVANAIRTVTEAGVPYLTAAGNDNLIDPAGNEIGSWERSEFHNAACPAVIASRVGEAAADCMNFSPSGTDATFGITVRPHASVFVDLQWAEPWQGVGSDLDVYLLNKAETQVVAEAESDNIAEEEPVELVRWKNTSGAATEVRLVIDRCVLGCNPASNAALEPRLKFALMEGGASKTEYPTSDETAGITVGPTIYGHAGSAAAITLGAVYFGESASAPRGPEYYSSRGPVTHYFGPVDGATAAAPLASPEVLQKPNLTATDCASTTFFANLWPDGWHFCGTSEAAPHAAAVAALMQEAEPAASPAAIVAAMEASATPFTEVCRRAAVGAGLVNADAAIAVVRGEAVGGAAGSGACEEVRPTEGTIPEATPIPSPAPIVPESTSPPAAVTAPPPTVTITKGPRPLGNDDRPTFEFTASGGASLTCQFDGGAARPCGSPYSPTEALADGAHGFVVTATDAQGRNASSGVYEFTVDTVPPRVAIVAHPHAVIRTRARRSVGSFRLRASESDVTFRCRFDRRPEHACPRRFRHGFGLGRHRLRVRAEDAAGNLSKRRAVFSFRVERRPR